MARSLWIALFLLSLLATLRECSASPTASPSLAAPSASPSLAAPSQAPTPPTTYAPLTSKSPTFAFTAAPTTVPPTVPYVAPVYTPKQSLVTIHNSLRILGQNTLVISSTSLSDIGSRQGPLFNYVIGVVVPAVAMIIMLVIWLFSLCCAKKCCKGCCRKNVALMLFVLMGMGSAGGWIAALAANKVTTQGFDDMINGVEAVNNFGNQIGTTLNGVSSYVDSLSNLTTYLNVTCQNNVNVTFPFSDIGSSLDSVSNAVSGKNGITDTISNFTSSIQDNIGMVNGYLQWRDLGTTIVLSFLLALTILWVFTTTLRVMDNTPESCQTVARVSSKFTAVIIFFLGVLLLIIIWVFIALIHVIITFGADFCVPDVNTNIDTILGSFLDANGTGSSDVCQDSSFLDSPQGTLCYYQTCSGPNYFANLTAPINSNAFSGNTTLAQYVAQVQNSQSSQPYPYNNSAPLSAACTDGIADFSAKIDSIGSVVQSALSILDCSTINPVYVQLLYNGMCNGMIDGLYVRAGSRCAWSSLTRAV